MFQYATIFTICSMSHKIVPALFQMVIMLLGLWDLMRQWRFIDTEIVVQVWWSRGIRTTQTITKSHQNTRHGTFAYVSV